MPEYRHPLAGEDAAGQPPARIHVSRAEKAVVDDSGVFEAPRSVGKAVAERYDVDASDIRVSGDGSSEFNQQSDGDTDSLVNDDSDTCQAEKSDGEVCGRDRPCPYHDKRGGSDE